MEFVVKSQSCPFDTETGNEWCWILNALAIKTGRVAKLIGVWKVEVGSRTSTCLSTMVAFPGVRVELETAQILIRIALQETGMPAQVLEEAQEINGVD
ncbi:hypothetical protein K2173_007798 [Erythroxylum novogranatense]|uniref:Uncharacterized protein n=1 Tax=Erythroxylum novogranatense TaxID=1862640 RepID=A0AAV8TEI4_9ROSI|nr:hypothetical protein K2173_007798 [Erythroxylum novogranatense]